jgi:hypothetical protein
MGIGSVRYLRLESARCDVDVRLTRVGRRWVASADAPSGPTLGWGTTSFDAIWMALAPFEGVIDQLLASLPEELAER